MPYAPDWLPKLATLARVHGRLAPPGLDMDDEAVARGLERHLAWPFYTPGMTHAQTWLAVEGDTLLAAAQAGIVGYGWGYGASWGDGPDWLHDAHLSIYWLLAWPGFPDALIAAAALAARIVGWARAEGLPGLEAFRGGPGFLPFGTQLSSYWPYLWGPLRAAGFRQPRALLVYSGETAPDQLPELQTLPRLEFHGARGRLEAWYGGEPAGVCAAVRLSDLGGDVPASDPRAATWAFIRRLAIDEAHRGQGIGAALFAEQLRRLHSRNVTRYLLHVPDSPDEQAAQGLYRKFGGVLDRQYVLRLSF